MGCRVPSGCCTGRSPRDCANGELNTQRPRRWEFLRCCTTKDLVQLHFTPSHWLEDEISISDNTSLSGDAFYPMESSALCITKLQSRKV